MTDQRRRRVLKKIKKIIAVLLMSLMCASLLCGCGGDAPAENEGSNAVVPTEEQTAEVDAAAVGEWIKISKKAEADKKNHNAKVRITKVITDEAKAKELIEEYNLSGVNETVSTDTGNDKVAYAAAEYEVVFAKDFPQGEFGITDVTVPFEVVGSDGGEKITFENAVFDGLTETEQIGSVPQGYDFYLPDHYKGKIAFLVPKGCKDVLLRTKDRSGEYAYVDLFSE